jgi:hypothetical protein
MPQQPPPQLKELKESSMIDGEGCDFRLAIVDSMCWIQCMRKMEKDVISLQFLSCVALLVHQSHSLSC